MKLPNVTCTSIPRLFFTLFSILLLAHNGAFAAEAAGYRLPQFRKVQGPQQMPSFPQGTVVRLLADQDFPPFSFAARSGEPAGMAVDLASAACAEIKLTCTIDLMAFSQLLPALTAGSGDVIVAGPRIDEASLAQAQMTRPWFRSFGRFAALTGSPLASGEARELAGKRIAAVKGTAHAAWLQSYYAGSEVVVFDSEELAGAALRTGNVDALFGDNLRLIYWVSGSDSRKCCKLLGGAVSDFEAFSRNIAFLVRSDRPHIREAFDLALDRLQENGTTEKIFNLYMPLSPW